MLTAARLRSLLHYDPATGAFTWAVSRGSMKAGKVAGSPHKDGYIQIKVDRVLYKAHRLAWLYVHGKWPKGRMDHADNIHDNNRIANLRLATHSQNMANRKLNANNTVGFKGVSRSGDGFIVSVSHQGRRYHLGLFPSPESAHAAYVAKAAELHGQFARTA